MVQYSWYWQTITCQSTCFRLSSKTLIQSVLLLCYRSSPLCVLLYGPLTLDISMTQLTVDHGSRYSSQYYLGNTIQFIIKVAHLRKKRSEYYKIKNCYGIFMKRITKEKKIERKKIAFFRCSNCAPVDYKPVVSHNHCH